ncbi:MAG: TolC family protein [Pseudomonadota bacterium]|nr:TolC family protein [Pseudomonadota bacterium]
MNYFKKTDSSEKKPATAGLTWLKYLLLIGIFGHLFGLVAPAPAECAELTIKKCVELALQNNPELQKQRLNLKLADEDIADRKSQDFGQLNIVSSYTHYNLPRTLAPMTPGLVINGPEKVPTTENLFNAGIVYEVALFTGFARTRSLEIAALQKEITGKNLKLSREQLIYNVKTLYVNSLSLQVQKKAQVAYVEALQRLHDNVNREVRLGKKARIDQLKTAADLKNAEAQQTRIEANITIMKASLANLLGLESLAKLEDVTLSPKAINSEMVTEKDFTGELASLERLQTTQLTIDKNTKLIQKEGGALYPQIVLNAGYGQNFGPNDSSNKKSGDWENQEVWQAGLNLKWNIFDFGSTKAKLRKARILENQSRHDQTKTELELKRALKEAVTKINTAVTDYNSAEAELALTRETETIEALRFAQGAADINDLLAAKARNQLAESRFIGAGYSYKNARFYLDYLLENGENR